MLSTLRARHAAITRYKPRLRQALWYPSVKRVEHSAIGRKARLGQALSSQSKRLSIVKHSIDYPPLNTLRGLCTQQVRSVQLSCTCPTRPLAPPSTTPGGDKKSLPLVQKRAPPAPDVETVPFAFSERYHFIGSRRRTSAEQPPEARTSKRVAFKHAVVRRAGTAKPSRGIHRKS